ncbi:hypothetical protein TNCV_2469271 [Trichonephila clavipes]|nr:hypothetical protein TNCV_2469271 [Trichonephila clavipes]
MFDPSSFANPTPLAHADTSRDVFPRGDSLEKSSVFQEATDYKLLQNLPSEISDVLTDDFSDDEVPANDLLEFSIDF